MKIIAYAITFKKRHHPVAIGLSVLDAWNTAERCLGDKFKDLKNMGYTIEEGTFLIIPKVKHRVKKTKRNVCPECWGEGERQYQGEGAPCICRRCGGTGKKKWKNKPNVCPKAAGTKK